MAMRPTTGASTKTDYMNKTVPRNPKFKGVTTKLDTGHNMRIVLEKYQGTSGPNAHKKKVDEFYVRLRPTTLGRLLEPLVEAEESIYQLGHEDTQSVQSVVPPSTAAESSEGNILILDLRPFEQFEQCHVYGARHYDVTNLNKASNNFPREVYFFKGPVECDKMVVLYDEDGREGARVGNHFVEKGIENTYVVTGGFLGVAATAPHVLVGDPPTPDALAAQLSRAGIKPSPGGGSQRSEAGYSARCSTAGSVRTQATRLTGVAGSVAGSVSQRAWK